MRYHIDDLINTIPCGFLSFTDDGNIVMINATLLTLLGYESDELWGRKIESILPIASRIFYQTHFFPLLKMQGKVEEIYFSLRSKQGTNIPMLINAVRRQKIDVFINDCIFIPIHQRIQYEDEILKAKKAAETAIRAQKEAEIALRQQYEQAILLRDITQRINQCLDLDQIFETAAQKIRQLIHADRVGIFKFYADTHYQDGRFISESVGKGFASNLGVEIHDHCFGEQYASYYQQGRIQALDDVENAALTDCHRVILAQLQIRANLVVPLLSGGDNLWGLLCIHQCSAPRHWQELEIDFIKQIAIQLTIAIQQADLLQQRQQVEIKLRESNQQLVFSNQELSLATEALEKLVNTDGLTQIANRRCFSYRLEQEWQRLYREQQPLSLLLFDVDYFKRYNDHYGHQLEDDCLIKLAQAAQTVVCRPADLVARYGGEEFVVILLNTDVKGAIAVAEKIHAAIQALTIAHAASEVSNTVTISLGISLHYHTYLYVISRYPNFTSRSSSLQCQKTRAQSIYYFHELNFMHLPSFIWLWKIAAWAMGLSLLAYVFLAITGVWMLQIRTSGQSAFIPPVIAGNAGMRVLHYLIGITMVSLVLLLLAIGIVGTLGHFGSLGHSSHLIAGLIVVALVLISAFSASQISARKPWARPLHIGLNILLFAGFAWVSLTGWTVVQKYLP